MKRFTCFIFLVFPLFCLAQDSLEILRDYEKIISIGSQPQLYYRTTIVNRSEPILQAEDSMTLHAEFYRNGNNMYSGNEIEEIYIQDSLMIQVNHSRKQIWISRADSASRQRMNNMPGGIQLKELMKKYTVRKELSGKSAKIGFETKAREQQARYVKSGIVIEYDRSSFHPLHIIIEMNMKEPAGSEMIAAMKEQGIDISKAVKQIDGENWLVRKQQLITSFIEINNQKEKAAGMPSWKTNIFFDRTSNEFIAKGRYEGFEITVLL